MPKVTAVAPTNGRRIGDHPITITGSDFGPQNDILNITIAGQLCTRVTWLSNTRIEVIAPYAPVNMTGNVTVISISYGVGTLENGYTYNPGMILSFLDLR